MRSLFLILPLLAVLGASGVHAEDNTGLPKSSFGMAFVPSMPASHLALGGVAERMVLHDEGNFSFGVTSMRGSVFFSPESSGQPGPMAGYIAWDGGNYRLDASLRRMRLGGVVAGMGAETGVAFGEMGTSYGIQLNAGLVSDRFSVNPNSRVGLVDTDSANSDLNLVVTVNQAITPSLSLTGQAEARRGFSSQIDGVGSRELLLGAGLGLRF